MHKKSPYLPNDGLDTALISDAYDRADASEKLPNLIGEEIAQYMAWRIYTEWCMSNESRWGDHPSYNGEAFDKWINTETHFALERAGFKWNKDRQCFEPDEAIQTIYIQTRKRVCEAATRRMVELIREWDGHYYPSEDGDRRNLRVSLQPYLEHEQTRAG